MEKPSVLIAGLGFLGEALGRLMSEQGYDVWGLRRVHSAESQQPWRCLGADLTKADDLRGRLPKVDYVCYMPSPDQRGRDAYEKIYRQGFLNLCDALPKAPQRLLYISSTSVYGQKGGEWVDETTEPEPTSEGGQIIRQAENLALSMNFPVTVLRLGGLYGPGREGLIRRILAGLEELDQDDDRYTNRIHKEDAARACLHILQLDEPADVYNGVDSDPAPRNVVIRWLCEGLQVALPKKKDQSLPPVRGNKRVANQRLLASGFDFCYPSFRDGYAHIVKEQN